MFKILGTAVTFLFLFVLSAVALSGVSCRTSFKHTQFSFAVIVIRDARRRTAAEMKCARTRQAVYCTYNATLRCILATIVAVEMQ